MNIDIDTARALKLAVENLYTSPAGLILIELLEEKASKYKPNYDDLSGYSMAKAWGMAEMMMTIRSLHRLTDEEIVATSTQERNS